MLLRLLASGVLILAVGSASESGMAQQPAAVPPTQPKAIAASPQAATPQAAAPAKRRRKHAKAPEPPAQPAEPVVQAPPPPPPTPEESPAVAPQVNYQNGQLSIRSENSTLGAILSAVKTRMGASVEAPGSTSSDRIATQIGPGDPRDVLSTLLNNTKYDFILMGTAGSPKSVQKIILTARAGGGAAAPQPNRPAQNFQPTEPPDADQEMPDAEIPDEANQPEQIAPPPQPDQQQPPQPPNGEPNQNQPKSPEQLLQELQRMQQQQQQQPPQQRPDQ